ncbi:MAG: hypothetical protein FJ104_17655, partial [Deltaproteobacteria bacterium]|nr:hypothetical protein [Deltaproteobacteria bacterium]
MASAGGADPGRLARLTFALAVVVPGVVLLARRASVAFTYPVPWPDEGSFLWQALAFRDTGGLFTPELNPTREVLWMPPGYMVLHGLLYRVVPFSLGLARSVSGLCLVAAFGLLGVMYGKLDRRYVHALLAGISLNGPALLMVGNVARMESLVLLVACLGYALLDRGRPAGLLVLLLGPLVHPNGLYPLAAACLLAVVRRRDLDRPGIRTFALLAAVLAAWVTYGLYAARHADSFVADMVAQLRFKFYVSSAEGGPLGRLGEPVMIGTALALGVGTWLARRDGRRAEWLAALGGALWVQSISANGWLYDGYPAVAALVGAIVLVEGLLGRVRGRAAALGVVGALVVTSAATVLFSPFLQRSLDRVVVPRAERDPVYVTESDLAAVRAYLVAQHVPGQHLAVQCIPDADALFFEDLRSPALGFVQQTMFDARSSIVISHESPWFPDWIRGLELLKVFTLNGTEPTSRVLAERRGGDRWIAYDFRPPGARPPSSDGAEPRGAA